MSNFNPGDMVDLKSRVAAGRSAPGEVIDSRIDHTGRVLVKVAWQSQYRDGIESVMSYRPDVLVMAGNGSSDE